MKPDLLLHPQGVRRRVPGGEAATLSLADHLTSHLNTPFAWGTHDCVCFAAAWVKALTGVDHLAEFQRWETATQAARVIKREGRRIAAGNPSASPLRGKQAGGLEAALDARFKRIAPSFAQDGDLALHHGCICIFTGAHIAGPGKTGLTHNSRVLAQAAWRVVA